MSDPGMESAPLPAVSGQSGQTDAVDLAVLFQAVSILDQKLDWCMQTLSWMSQVFQGLQAMTSIMPGKAGKMARDMMAQMGTQQAVVPAVENGDSSNG